MGDNKEFKANAAETTETAFDTLRKQFDVVKFTPKVLRQDYVRECLNNFKKLDILSLPPVEQEETLLMTTHLSTWAKRGSLRQEAVNHLLNIFEKTGGNPALEATKLTCANIIVESNKPSHAVYFHHYIKVKSPIPSRVIPRP